MALHRCYAYLQSTGLAARHTGLAARTRHTDARCNQRVQVASQDTVSGWSGHFTHADAHQLHPSYLDVGNSDTDLGALPDLDALLVLVINPEVLATDVLELELCRHRLQAPVAEASDAVVLALDSGDVLREWWRDAHSGKHWPAAAHLFRHEDLVRANGAAESISRRVHHLGVDDLVCPQPQRDALVSNIEGGEAGPVRPDQTLRARAAGVALEPRRSRSWLRPGAHKGGAPCRAASLGSRR